MFPVSLKRVLSVFVPLASVTLVVMSPASASILSVGEFADSQFGLTVETPAPGTVVTEDFIANNGLPDGIAFAEQQNVTLSTPLALDTGGTLAAGTVVSSYFVGFDNSVGGYEHTYVTFSTAVLGIEYIDGGNLGPSDILGLPSLSYDTGCTQCGYESGDTVSFSGDTADFSSSFSEPGDYARVITGVATTTSAVPEPATLAIFGTALMGLVGAVGRRRNASKGYGNGTGL